MTTPLHLIRLRIDAQRLFRFARQSSAVAREFDEGYAVHALLAALFDHGAAEGERVSPRPFRITSSQARTVDVLGYGRVDHLALRDRARSFADPIAWDACDLDAIASRPMPDVFPSGTRMGFSIRACPIRRIAKRGPMTRDRAEVDAFLAKSWEVGKDVALDRAEVYRQWLGEELAKDGAAKLIEAAMTSFKIERLLRRTKGEIRKGHPTQRPDVTFDGALEVTDSAAFCGRLARGLGRHRAFGFGMLLLKPAAAR